MIGKNSGFSPKSISAMSSVMLVSLSLVAYSIVNAQTQTSEPMILKLNNTVFNDPLRNAILTFSDGTTIFDTQRTSDPSTGSNGMINSDPTDSSNEAASSDSDSDSASDSPATTPTRTTSLDSSNTGPTGQVGSGSGEVGSGSGEVGSGSGEVGTSTGEARSSSAEVGS